MIGNAAPTGSPTVREGFIRHAERHLQVLPTGSFGFRANSSPSPPTTPRQPRQPPQEDLVGCLTQSRDEVKGWVRSNAGMLLLSSRSFDKTVYKEMLAALRPGP